MRVALVRPKWHEIVNSYPFPGLGYLAAITEQEGHEAAVFDMELRPASFSTEDVKRVVGRNRHAIAFTPMTTSNQSVEEAVVLLKQALPAPINIGGPQATTLPELVVLYARYLGWPDCHAGPRLQPGLRPG